MKPYRVLLCALCLLNAAVVRSDASTLYGSSSGNGTGELYILDPATGNALLDIGPLNDSLGTNLVVTGLAFHPITGVLYGSTGGKTGTLLLTINPATGLVTVVGSFGVGVGNTMTDIAFDTSGNLFGIGSVGGPTLYSINLSTGQATAIGSTGLLFTQGGGLAISAGGTFFGVPQGNDFGTYNPTTGVYTFIGTMATPAGVNTSYAAMAFDGNTLYGIDLGNPPHLTTIDPATGTVTDLGTTPLRIDGIAFKKSPPAVTIKPTTTNSVVVSWPVLTPAFRLQQNTNLTTTNWIAYTNSITPTNGTNLVTFPLVGRSMFFRLISP